MLSCLPTRYSGEVSPETPLKYTVTNLRQDIQAESFPLRSPGLKAKYIVNYLVIIFILSCSIEIF